MSPLHRAARAFADAGIPVFPVEENGKRPLPNSNGFHDATTDLAKIDAWWGENPNYNLALCPADAGWAVVDLDVGENKNGIANWNALAHERPETYVVRTPRGGEHWYYEGEIGPSASKVARDVDTRGVGSYVLVPPSVVDGKPYEVIHEREIAKLPAWVVEAVAAKRAEVKAAVHELDLPGSVARAEHYLRTTVAQQRVAVSGSGGNDLTYRVACDLLNLGLSVPCALDLTEAIWNPACVPPWPRDELETIFQNASRYAQNEAGAWAVAPAEQTFAAALDKISSEAPPERRSRFHPETEDEQDDAPEPKWLVKDLIQESTTVLWFGATQSYKSFLALDVALSIAAGKSTFGTAPEVGPVFYAALEGKTNIKTARRRAWRIAREIDSKIENFFVMTAPLVAIDEQVQEFGDEIAAVVKRQGRQPKLIVLDTLSKCLAGLNENDASDANRFMRFCDSLVETFGCAVLAIHHTGKDDGRGARGSSAFHAGFDSVIEIRAERKTKAAAAYVRKHKDAEERETPWTFQGRLIGPSLVFFPTTPEEHHNLTLSDDDFEPRKVGAALQSLGAYGAEHGVTTYVLAQTLLPAAENETPEQRAIALGRFSKKLGAQSHSKLKAYNEPGPNGVVWCLPPPGR